MMRYKYKSKKPIRKQITVLGKKCCYCWNLKLAEEFYRSRKSKDGLRSECKACGKSSNRLAYQQKKREEQYV